MMKLSKALKLTFLGALLSSNVYASGIPTIDGAAIANQISTWKIEAERWVKTVEEYKKAYQAQLDQIATQTGARDILGFVQEAQKHYDKVKDLKQFIDNPNLLLTYGKDALTSELKAIYDRYGMTDICKHKDEKERKLCEGNIILTATTEAQNKRDMDILDDRIQSINKIADRMAKAKDTKEAQDLSNAMQAQIALLQADSIRRDIQSKQTEQQQRLIEQQARNKIIKDMRESTKNYNTKF